MNSVNQALGGTIPTVDAVAKLLGQQLPATLGATRETLSSLASTAQIIDDFLAALTSIPLFNIQRYSPEVPLSQGVQEVATSLEEIPRSLGEAQEGLAAAGDGLEGLQGELDAMVESVSGISASLENARTVLVEYQAVVADLQSLVTRSREGLPQWLRWLRIGLSLILVWLGIAQIGLLTQGWELIRRSRKSPPAAEPAASEDEPA